MKTPCLNVYNGDMTIQATQPKTAVNTRFSRGPNPAYTIMDMALKGMSPLQNAGGWFLKMKDGAGGNMHFQFIQDTSILWTPKAAVSRSFLDLFEITFVEFAESAFFYYITPILAGFGLSWLFPKVMPKKFKIHPKLVSTPISKIAEVATKHGIPINLAKSQAIPLKLGIAITSIAFGALGNYALNFVKNIITEKGFKKNDFSSIIGYTDKKVEDTGVDSPVYKKAKNRLVWAGILTAGSILLGLGLSRFGYKIKPGGFFNKLESAAKILDFDYKPIISKKTGEVSMTFFDLGPHHLKFIIPAAVWGYIDAARDKLEKVEVACRTIITGGYIAYLQPWWANAFNRRFGKSQGYRELGIMKGEKFNDVMTLKELQEYCHKLADTRLRTAGNHTPSVEMIQKEAAKLFKERLVAKSKLFFIPYLFGILGVGLTTAVMNRIWTDYRFKQTQKEEVAKRDRLPVIPRRPARSSVVQTKPAVQNTWANTPLQAHKPQALQQWVPPAISYLQQSTPIQPGFINPMPMQLPTYNRPAAYATLPGGFYAPQVPYQQAAAFQ